MLNESFLAAARRDTAHSIRCIVLRLIGDFAVVLRLIGDFAAGHLSRFSVQQLLIAFGSWRVFCNPFVSGLVYIPLTTK